MTPWTRQGGMLVPSNGQERNTYMQGLRSMEEENQRRIRDALAKAGQSGFVPDASAWSATGGNAITNWGEPAKPDPIQTTGQLSGPTSVSQPAVTTTTNGPVSSPQDAATKRRLGMIEEAEKQAQTNLRERAGVGGGSLYDPSFGAAQQEIVEKRQQATQNAYADMPTPGAGSSSGSRYSEVGVADPRPVSGPQMRTQEPQVEAAIRRFGANDVAPPITRPSMTYENTNNVYAGIEQRALSGQGKPANTVARPTDQASFLPRAQEVYRPGGSTAKYTPPSAAQGISPEEYQKRSAVGGDLDWRMPAPQQATQNTGGAGVYGSRYGTPSAADQRQQQRVQAFGRIETRGNGYYDGSGIQLGVPGQGGWSGGKGGGASGMGFQTQHVGEGHMRQVQARRDQNDANLRVRTVQSPEFVRDFRKAGGSREDYQRLLDRTRQLAFIQQYQGTSYGNLSAGR